jgi:hypothetical protein
MAEAVQSPGIGAGRQTPAHERLSRLLWLRKRGEVYRFLLDPEADPGLTLERIGRGDGGLIAREAEARGAGRVPDSGLVIVDGEDGLAFCTKAPPQEFLPRLARYAAAHVASVPALALLADSGAGPLTIDLADDAAALAFMPHAAQVFYDPELWDELLPPSVATIATALAAATPGERMWFWLAEEQISGALPLILQPVAWDPNHDRTNWLIDRNSDAGAGEGASGAATICDDGTLQFLGVGLHRSMLEGLARWAKANVAEYPALGRLVDCELVVSAGSEVEAVIADPMLWQGIPRAVVPGTIRGTASVLENLAVGDECWFWLTGSQTSPAFLHLAPVAEDPEGVAFRADLPRLFARFPQSFADAISGVMNRPAASRLLFTTLDAATGNFPHQVQMLLDRYGEEFPVLRALHGATLLKEEADGRAHVAAATAAA